MARGHFGLSRHRQALIRSTLLLPSDCSPAVPENIASAINGSGQIVGTSYDSSREIQALAFSSETGLTGLGSLPGLTQTAAYGGTIADGDIVGAAIGTGVQTAFLYTKGTGMVGLGALPGDFFSEAFGINDHGEVVGDSAPAANGSLQQAFTYQSNKGMVGIGTLPGATYSSAWLLTILGKWSDSPVDPVHWALRSVISSLTAPAGVSH